MADSIYPDPKFRISLDEFTGTTDSREEEVTLELNHPSGTLSFGKYKGQRYEDIETSYLKWMVKELQGTRPLAAETARRELQRRELGEDLDDSTEMVLDLTNRGDRTLEISREFIDEATKHPEFLKAFLLREHKELGLISWIHKKACWALMTGVQLESSWSERVRETVLFEGFEYTFEGERSDRDGRYDHFRLVLWKKRSR